MPLRPLKTHLPELVALVLALGLLIVAPARAQEEDTGEEAREYARLEAFSVLGDVAAVAGSAHFLGPTELDAFDHGDVLRVLRDVPGVYLQEEEGYGLRPNIGIRGSGLDRSSRITLLEDGVLISPAPYAAPAAYYFPNVQRMYAVEVVKGPAAIALGPRTTGGALNMLSTPVPDLRAGSIQLNVGEDSLFQGTARLGDANRRVAWLVEANRQQTAGFKRLDGGGDTGFTLNDYISKVRVSSGAGASWQQSLEFKLGYWEHDADETYLGLTEEDFAVSPYRRYAGSQEDRLFAHHSQYQATWTLTPDSHDWDLSVTAYHNDFHRNWMKLGKVSGHSISRILGDPETYAQELAWLRGEADSPEDALNLRNNNREYFSRGIQAILHRGFRTGRALHELELGLRAHEDEEDRLQDEDLYRIADGRMERTTDGAAGSQSNRVSAAKAWSLHASDRIRIGDWSLSPGLRFEHISLRRRDFLTSDPLRTLGPSRSQVGTLDIWVPGIGMTWQASPSLLAVAGINRGFNPPAPGSDARAEKSLNLEAGLRYRNGPLALEAIGFVSDYRNLVGTCTASTGGNCEIGDQFDGGEAIVRGIEFLGRYRFTDVTRFGLGIPLDFNYTWTPTADFDNDFDSGFEPWGTVTAGDRMPYVPEQQLQLGAGLEGHDWDVMLKASYQDRTRTVAGSGSIPASESTDSRVVVDLVAHWRLSPVLEISSRVENLTNEVYNVARRPAGLRPGMPRSLSVGLRYDF